MEDSEKKTGLVGSMIEQFEEYIKTTYELFKLKTVDKISNIASLIVSRLCSIIVLFIFVLILNIAVALWVGELLGKSYYGFFCVAAFDALLWIILRFWLGNWIKKRIADAIISKYFN